MAKITIEGTEVIAELPEGARATVPLEELIGRITPPRMDTGDIVMPDGVKCMFTEGPFSILVHQTPPKVFPFKWVAEDSEAQYGRGTKYSVVRMAQPYVIVFAVFGPDPSGRPTLIGRDECFYRVGPIASVNDELLYPGLLNCSKYPSEDGNPLSWICTQFLDLGPLLAISDSNERVRKSVKELLHVLFETGFNYSSEHHEGSSWYSESRGLDRRVGSVEAWQKATETDPLFVLEVPWLATGRSVRQVAERIFCNLHASRRNARTSGDLARIVFHGKKKSG